MYRKDLRLWCRWMPKRLLRITVPAAYLIALPVFFWQGLKLSWDAFWSEVRTASRFIDQLED